MKLIEALREADRRGFPQIKENYFEENTSKWTSEIPPSCALGGALMAAGLIHFQKNVAMTPLSDRVTPSEWFGEDLPCDLCESSNGGNLVPHLNDYHELTRTEIANYLEAHGFDL